MSVFKQIQYSVEGGVARLTLNRPEALNALTFEMMEEVISVLKRIEADPEIRVLLLTGAGRGFCSGQDLRSRAPLGIDVVAFYEERYLPAFAGLRSCRVPVVIAVNGVAAGGGCALALCGDVVLAARSAKFIQLFSRIGIAPDLGSTFLLPRLIGRARSLAMMLTGEPMSGEEAARCGLVSECVEDERLQARAAEIAEQLARGPTMAYRLTRQLVDEGDAERYAAQFRRELEANQILRESNDGKEGVAAFLEKRKPVYRGH